MQDKIRRRLSYLNGRKENIQNMLAHAKSVMIQVVNEYSCFRMRGSNLTTALYRPNNDELAPKEFLTISIIDDGLDLSVKAWGRIEKPKKNQFLEDFAVLEETILDIVAGELYLRGGAK